MGPLPDHRVEIGAIFQSVAIDLFGPIEYQGTVSKRQVGLGMGVVFVCTTTSAVHIEFMDTYSTDSFLMVHVPKSVGFQRGSTVGGQERNQMGPGADRRATLQQASRENDRADQKADLAEL
jgi:hypothetical protein